MELHPLPGARIESLVVERELGRGAFAVVYLARDELLRRHVALKVLRVPGAGPGTPEGERALAEARLVGALSNPHIVTLYRVHAREDLGWLFEMEYLDRGSLDALLAERNRLAPDQARDVLRAVLRGLAAAHEAGIVHGDVKPANVLLGSRGAVKIADFGLGFALRDAERLHPDPEARVGTPFFMAPEVVMGDPPSFASDLWSVGVVLYRMLAGRLPFLGEQVGPLFHAIQNLEPPPLDPDTPLDLAEICLRCLAKRPADRPASAAELLARLDAEARRAAPLAARPPPTVRLVARTAELSRVDEALSAAEAAVASTLLVTGGAGSGKSALLQAASERARARGFRCLEVAVTPLEGLRLPLLRGFDRLLEEAPSEASIVAIRQLLDSVGRNLPGRLELATAVGRAIESLPDARPLALFVDDAHEADAEELTFLRGVLRRARGRRVFVAVAARSEALAVPDFLALASEEGVQRLELANLPPEALFALLDAQFPNLRVAPEVAAHVIRLAEGNPRFARDLLHHLAESGAVVRRGSLLVPGASWSAASLPARIRDLALRRVEGLPEDDRALLEAAAVDGRRFDGEALAAVLDRPLLEVLRRLQRLGRDRELVLPDAGGYRFANPALQEILYDSIAPALRTALHARYAEYWESRGAPAPPERIGLHWERAGRHDRAVPHLLRAAGEAAARQELRRSIEWCARAGVTPERGDDALLLRHADSIFEVVVSFTTLGRHAEAERLLERVRDAADRAGDDVLRLRTAVRIQRSRLLVRGSGHVDEAVLREAAERLPRVPELGRALYVLAILAKYRGRLDEAEALLRRADEVFLELGDDHMHSGTLDQLASIHLRRGHYREAEALYSDSVRVAWKAGRRLNAAISEVNRVLAAARSGAREGLVSELERAIRTLELEGATESAAHARVSLASLLWSFGEPGAAEREASAAADELKRTGYLAGLSEALTLQAELQLAAGRLDACAATLAEARAAAEGAESRDELALAQAIEAAAAAAGGACETACERAARSLAFEKVSAPARAGILHHLCRACLFGLDPAALAGAERFLEGAELPRDELDALRRVVFGTRALAPDGDPARIADAAAALRATSSAEDRAVRVAWADLLDARAALRGDRRSLAADFATRARGLAQRAGHRWLAEEAARVVAQANARAGRGA